MENQRINFVQIVNHLFQMNVALSSKTVVYLPEELSPAF